MVKAIEAVETRGDKPIQEVKIVDSGAIPVETPFSVTKEGVQ